MVLDQRYRHVPGWESLPQCKRLGWAALAAALDVHLGQPDYTVDDVGWRPLTKPIRSPAKPGILGVLQAEHDLLVRLQAFPHVVNLRLVVDAQRLVSGQLAPVAARIDENVSERWGARAATYDTIRRQLRDVGGLLGTGTAAAAQAATIASRLKGLPPNSTMGPRTLGGFQMLFDKVDLRIADILEEGVDRGAFAQRVPYPRLASGTGELIQPVRDRFRPVTNADDLAAVQTARAQLRPRTARPCNKPGATRAELHAALIHQPLGRGPAPNVQSL